MPIISNFPFAGGGAGPVTPDYSSWFGTGEDGDLTVSSDVALPVALDSGQIIKQYNNLTVTSTGILHPANRCNGMILLVKGDLTVDGTIHVDKCAPLLNDSEQIAAQEQHVALCGVTSGGRGGDGGSAVNNTPYKAGEKGFGGPGFSFGGGYGGGGASLGFSSVSTAGSCLQRPPLGTVIPYDGQNNDSKYGIGGGGNGGSGISYYGGNGPGGGGANGVNGSGDGGDGDAIGGGAVWIFVAGKVRINSTARISAQGGNAGSGSGSYSGPTMYGYSGCGGGAGGGIVCLVHTGDIVNQGSVVAPGGTSPNPIDASGGSGTNSAGAKGQDGEEGTVLIAKISDLVGDEIDGGISYDLRPKIDFDGKWVKWFVEFYDGEPYWEAWFFSSGTLTCNGSYTADAWLIGGGRCGKVGSSQRNGGNGKVSTTLDVDLNGSVSITIGAGVNSYSSTAGTTSLGNLASAGGASSNNRSTNEFYRFSDPDKSNERGADSPSNSYNVTAFGGWLNWKSSYSVDVEYGYGEGEGYGAAGMSTTESSGHPGALVIRIKI